MRVVLSQSGTAEIWRTQRVDSELKKGNGGPTEHAEYSEKGWQSRSMRRCVTQLAIWSEFSFVPCVDSLIRAAREIRGSTPEFPTTDRTDFHG